MARRNPRNTQSDNTSSADEVTTETHEENDMSTATPEATTDEAVTAEAEVEATVNEDSTEVEATEAEAPAEAPAEIDLTAFQSAVDAAIEGKDSATGDLAIALIDPVQAAYRQLDGLKAKNLAKKVLNEGMKDSMNSMDLQSARSYMLLSDSLAAATASHARSERTPADPTEAFVQRVVGLQLALTLAKDNVAEGVAEDWSDKANELFASSKESATAFYAYVNDESEDKGEEPEVSNVVKAAVKLAQGKAAKVGGSSRAGGGSTFTGERRDIAKHITEAFADKEHGEFLSVAEIRKFRSEEYGDNPPSAGAISARLFPKSGKCTIEGVEPATSSDGKGNKGAVKA